MALADIILTLRNELYDPEEKTFSDAVLSRCIQKAVFRIARDLSIDLTVVDGEISPEEPTGETLDMLLLLSRIHACQVMRAATANAFRFSSGDKSADKSGQPKQWGELEESLEIEYRQRLSQIRPQANMYTDGIVLTPETRPVLTERGSGLLGPRPITFWRD